MSSNRRGGGSGGGSGGGKRRNYNNNRNNDDNDDDGSAPVNIQLANNNTVAMGTTTTASTVSPVEITLSSSSSSSNNSSGEGTAVFNTADEGDEEELRDGTVEEISSEEEEDGSVVNASLIVNLSHNNANNNSSVVFGGSPGPELGSFGGSCHGDGGGVEESVSSRNLSSNQGESPRSKSDDKLSSSSSPQQQPTDPVPTDPVNEFDDDESSSTLADSEVEKLMMVAHRISARKAREVVEGLPSTVTVLKAPNGVVVYVVGTAHFSQQSQVDVAETIQMTQPTIVLLELCSSRKNILDLDEETVLREVSEMNFQKVRLALSNSGTVQGTLHLLLLSMSAQLTKKLGMAPGGEFRVATREGRKIPGSVILLGDRPFNITISRALAALSVFQKIKLAWQFLTCNEDITREEIEKCKEKDLLERMLTEMTGEFPTITEVFVNERDVYLAHSLYLAATSEAHKSNGGPVVGVVGMGHVAGIVRNWGKTTDGMVNEIVRIPPTPLSTILIRKSLKLLTYGLLGYAVYRVGRRVSLPESFKAFIGDGGSRVVMRFKDGVKGIGGR